MGKTKRKEGDFVSLIVSDIPISVFKKKIKQLHIYVKPPNGNVTVSAPMSASNEKIEQFVRKNINWIKKHVSRFEDQYRSERKYVTGETLYVWGKEYNLQVEYGNKNSLVLSDDMAILIVRDESTAEERKTFLREWYRGILKTEITQLLPKWEMMTGLKASGWQTRYMTTRWGSCNTKTGKIWLNTELAKRSPECLEYVILHELAHLVERNHNERFKAFMDRYMPAWREIKASLNRQMIDYIE